MAWAPQRPSSASWITAQCRIAEGFGAAAGLNQITVEAFAAWWFSSQWGRAGMS
jgi:hypothetical protein